MMRTKKLKNIKVLIWDVDGALYQSIPEYFSAMEKKQLELLSRVKRISLLKAKDLFLKKKKIYISATKTLVKLGCGNIYQVAQKIEAPKPARFIKKDPKLLTLFKSLKKFRHLALRNGTFKGAIKTLLALGFGEVDGFLPQHQSPSAGRCGVSPRILDRSHPALRGGGSPDVNLPRVALRQERKSESDDKRSSKKSFGVFERVFGTVDDFGTVKPDEKVFKEILEYTKLPAEQHLMIGDRVEVDLIPAKKLGMKTCLVWSKSNDPSVDFVLPTIYDIVKILK